MTKQPAMVRQGDVLLIPVKPLTKEQKEIKVDFSSEGAVVLAHGEATGHKHQIALDYATMYEWQGDRLIEVKEGAEIHHEEHSTITLPAGAYQVIRQKEFHPQRDRFVAD